MSPLIYLHDLDPILLRLGGLRVGWYGLMYAIGFMVCYQLTKRQIRRHGGPLEVEKCGVLLTYIILGVILGGRLGWVIFYGGLPYLAEPWRILETWKGGMSFHGGMLGVLAGMWLYSQRHRVSLLEVGDLVVSTAPIALFFGRIGNFINGELYGKPTDGSWGVVFPTDPTALPRHPSQLYEAVLEGLLLFFLLQWLMPRLRTQPGLLAALFLLGYGLCRIVVEFVRLPDQDIGYLLWDVVTMGQLLSLPMVLVGLGWVILIRYKQRGL